MEVLTPGKNNPRALHLGKNPYILDEPVDIIKGTSLKIISDISVEPYEEPRIQDIDGNPYDVIIVGSQEWTVQNLRVTHYSDDTPISNITIHDDWFLDTVGAYCWYDNDIGNKWDYGALYNWYVISNVHGLIYFEREGVPETGWRVPANADWANLANALGGDSYCGSKLREVGTIHWNAPNTGTNESGFTAVGAGYRVDEDPYIGFVEKKVYTFFWSATQYSPTFSYFRVLDRFSTDFYLVNSYKTIGFSIRCVRDVV